MATTPFVPEQIIVHLGRPSDSSAANVTVDFPDYIKNVASSELYPTWPENALRANIYAIISFTLNRIYTEWYRSQGYNFDITNSIQFDQSYNPNGEAYQPISDIVDEIFNDYLRRQGSVEPLFAVYCDGIEATCNGLTQWGSVSLANQGYTPYEILTNAYGTDIDIVQDAPILPAQPSYPGSPLTIGSAGNEVGQLQVRLNRISSNYPAIPKIYPVSTVYEQSTADAVRAFQEIFGLPANGVTDKATWYKINYIYVSVKRLAQINSEGLTLEETSLQYPETLGLGATGTAVIYLQYFLQVVSAYYNAVLPLPDVTGTFDEATENSLKSFQQVFGLPQTGVVDRQTWNDLYRAYAGIVENVPINIEGANAVLYPGNILSEGMTNEYVRVLQQYLSYLHQTYPDIPDVSATGYFGPITRNAVLAFQRRFGITPSGSVGAETWEAITNAYSELRYGYQKQPGQYPGYIIK